LRGGDGGAVVEGGDGEIEGVDFAALQGRLPYPCLTIARPLLCVEIYATSMITAGSYQIQ
jgi:hypothetical protein